MQHSVRSSSSTRICTRSSTSILKKDRWTGPTISQSDSHVVRTYIRYIRMVCPSIHQSPTHSTLVEQGWSFSLALLVSPGEPPPTSCHRDMTAQMPTSSTSQLARKTLHSPEPLPSLFYHLLALALCLYTQRWALQLAPLSFLVMMFTIWTGWVQLAYFVLYCTAALLSLSAGAAAGVVSGLRCATSLLLSAMFLCTFGTALIFWCIFLYDDKLIVPEGFVYNITLNRQPLSTHEAGTQHTRGMLHALRSCLLAV